MGNNHDYNIDCRGLQVVMIIVVSFPFMVAITAEAAIPTTVQTILLWRMICSYQVCLDLLLQFDLIVTKNTQGSKN
jgi:hypothetical protein